MSQFIKNLKTPIAIIGMGKSGEAAVRLLRAAGVAQSYITTFDAKSPLAMFQEPSRLIREVNPQTLVVSPGVPLKTSWLQEAGQRGVKITSELSLACSVLEDEKIIGVTGALGKSTTVSILGAGLGAFCTSYFVGGNLGIPFSHYAAEILENKRKRAEWVVLELSSYQLENCENLALEFSAITYLTSNHLERYNNLSHYYETKWSIFARTRKLLFLNKNGGDLASFAAQKNPDPERTIVVSPHTKSLSNQQLHTAKLIGIHNQDNLALAASLALAAGWPLSSIEGMKSFAGLEHRLENMGTINGVRFINDSKATALDSVVIATAAAMENLEREGNLFLLLGGRDKNLPWEELQTLNKHKNIEFVFFGECRAVAQTKSSLPGNTFEALGEAVNFVLSKVKPKDTVLLSPGGTSLDEFKSFEDRGLFFKNKVCSYGSN